MRPPAYCNAVTIRSLPDDSGVQVDLAYDPFGAGEPGAAAEIAAVVMTDATARDLVRQLAVRGIRA